MQQASVRAQQSQPCADAIAVHSQASAAPMAMADSMGSQSSTSPASPAGQAERTLWGGRCAGPAGARC